MVEEALEGSIAKCVEYRGRSGKAGDGKPDGSPEYRVWGDRACRSDSKRTAGRSDGNGDAGDPNDHDRNPIVGLQFGIRTCSDSGRSWMRSIRDGGSTGRLRLWELDERRGNERRVVHGADGSGERGGNRGEHSGTETMFQRRNIGVMP